MIPESAEVRSDLRQHVLVEHCNAEAPNLTYAGLLEYHADEHRGPGTIRDHPASDLSYRAEVRSDQPAPSYEKGADWTGGPIEPPAAPSLREALEAAIGVYENEGDDEESALDAAEAAFRVAFAFYLYQPAPPHKDCNCVNCEGTPFDPPPWKRPVSDPGSPSDGGLDVERLARALDKVMPWTNHTASSCHHGMSAHNREGCIHCECRTPGFGHGSENERDAADIAAEYARLSGSPSESEE